MSSLERTAQASLFEMNVDVRTRAQAQVPHSRDGVAVATVVEGGGFGTVAIVMLVGDQVQTASLRPEHFDALLGALIQAKNRIVASASSQPVTIQ